MAGIRGKDPENKTALKVKEQVEKAVKNIVASGGYDSALIDEAMTALNAFKDFKMKHWVRFDEIKAWCPEEFKCPLSKKLMADPVIVASGKTYDRFFIEKHMNSGDYTCPVTQTRLMGTDITANLLIKDLIRQWCTSQDIEFPTPVKFKLERNGPEVNHLSDLVIKTTLMTADKKREGGKELRWLTRTLRSFKVSFNQFEDAFTYLAVHFNQENRLLFPDVYEDITATFLNATIDNNLNKNLIKTTYALPFLIEALQLGATKVRAIAAAALFSASSIQQNKKEIAKEGGLKQLIKLFKDGHPLVIRDSASAIFRLCTIDNNKERAVDDGLVHITLEKIKNGVLLDLSLAILALISRNEKAITEMANQEAVPLLIDVIRNDPLQTNKESTAVILRQMCITDPTTCSLLWQEEQKYRSFSKLAKNGTMRAKKKAAIILKGLLLIIEE